MSKFTELKKNQFIFRFFFEFKNKKTKNYIVEFWKNYWVLTQMRNEKLRWNCLLKTWLNFCAEIDKILENQKTEQNSRITSDFHSTEKTQQRNLSKFAELKTVDFTQSR